MRVNRRWCIRFAFPSAVLLAASPAVLGTPLLTDGFNYTSGATLNGQIDTQETPNQTWATAGAVGSGSTIGTGSLTGPTNVPAVTGNLVQLSSGKAGADRIALETAVPASLATTTQTNYYSALVKVNSITSFTSLTGSFFAGLNNQTGATTASLTTAGAVLCIAAPTGAAAGNTNFVLGVGENQAGTGARVFDQSNIYTSADTLFVVVGYTINPGTNNDVAKLYVYKNPGAVDTAEPATANATSDGAALAIADIPDAGFGIASFFVRNNSVEPPGIQVDEVRVGTTWSDAIGVAPSPEPASLALLGIAVAPLLGRRRRMA
jgi:hypothetical protein